MHKHVSYKLHDAHLFCSLTQSLNGYGIHFLEREKMSPKTQLQ